MSAAQEGCAPDHVRCVGAGAEYNTSSTSTPGEVFISATDDAQPGDVIRILAGEYVHNVSASVFDTFWLISSSGTPGAPIRIEPYGNGPVLLKGFGFEDNAAGPSRSNERIIDVSGDHIEISGLEISGSSRFGLVARGSHGRFDNLIVHDNWESNILVLSDGPIEDNWFTEIETYRSRHGSGIWIVPASADPQSISGTRITNSISYENGFQADGLKVPAVPGDPAGGGNSDGIAVFKACHDSAPGLGIDNLCPGTIIHGNVVFKNADDGIDTSGAGDNLISSNISFLNGPEGNKGYKVFSRVVGGLDFIGNVAVSQSSFGFELQFVGPGNVINNTALFNDQRGFQLTYEAPDPAVSSAINNLSAFNGGSTDWKLEIVGSGTVREDTNFLESDRGDPQLKASSIDLNRIVAEALERPNTLDKVMQVRAAFRAVVSPRYDSVLVDAGTIIPGVHCPNASTKLEPNSSTSDCRQWTGAAPDIGALEFEKTPPTSPILLSVSTVRP